MSRHRKFIKSERAKTKLKGNKLAKGLNVTKTDFKIKKIIIREQIKDTTLIEDGTEIRSQNIKALLTKLNHHNATNRNEGLRYLKELVTNHPQEASNHLGEIIKGICQLALDIEKDVRHECFKALNLVFASQSATLILPFFNVITSYLRCAMTHINKRIQEDSLFMLDCLLLYTPELVAANSDSIFTSFLDMISKLRLESKPERTLTINLGSKMTSVNWRSKVLDRLLSILKAIVDRRKSVQIQREQKTPSETIDAFSAQQLPLRPFQINNQFIADAENRFSIFGGRRAEKNCDLPSLFRRNTGAANTTVTQQLLDNDEGQRIRMHAELLMPLLFETWMEVRPANLRHENASFDNDQEDACLSNEAAYTLKTIVDVICQLLELMKIWNREVNNADLTDWFRKNYGQQFCALFMVGFPYSQSDGFKGSKRKSKGVATEQNVYEAGGQKCYQQNLNISFIFTCLMPELTAANTLLADKIVQFLKNNLLSIDTNQTEVSAALVKLLRTILIENGGAWNRSLSASIVELLSLIISYDDKNKFSREIASKIFNLLCGIVTKQVAYYPKDTFTSWLSKLPKMLCQPQISQNALKTFELLAKMNNAVFMENLQANIEPICSNLSVIRVNGIECQTEGKRMIVNLFFWLKSWTPNSTGLPEEERMMIQQIVRIRNI